jgi:hypothetical protein
MSTKNNWFSTNWKKRLENPNLDFEIEINLYPFKQMSFDEAADFTCREIDKDFDNLFLSLSGGMDSDFILQCFHRNNIKIKPIIVVCGNEKENNYAYESCKELKIEPIIIKVSEKELFEIYKKNIYENMGGTGFNSTHSFIAAKYTESKKGTLIIGNHLIGDGDDMISDDEYLLSNEWDFYNDSVCQNVDFFLYTPEIAYSLMPNEYTSWNKHKQKIYKIKYRDKIRPNYSDETEESLLNLYSTTPKYGKTGIVWSKEKFFTLFEEFKLT